MAASEAELFLIEAVQKGDPAAWRQIIERYQGRLVNFARRMLAQRSDAEDIVQETFMGFLRSLPNYDATRSLETYLFAILRHKLHDYFRKLPAGQRESLEHLSLDDAPSAWLTAETPSRHAADAEAIESQRAALVHALRDWVEQCRAQQRFQELIVVEMLVVLGMRNKDVAEDLSLTQTAVAGVKFRVLEAWRKMTQASDASREWTDADLARDSTVGRIWREDHVSCLKRSTLGSFLLGALDGEWNTYVDFHVNQGACAVCKANLEDLREEESRDENYRKGLAERCFASSIGFLSRPPPA
jgi:RNA polymerase sigma-70 factor (ECF subfamily)